MGQKVFLLIGMDYLTGCDGEDGDENYQPLQPPKPDGGKVDSIHWLYSILMLGIGVVKATRPAYIICLVSVCLTFHNYSLTR